MKQKLESILNKGKILFLAGVASLAIGCVSSKQYIEAKIGLISPVLAEKQVYNPSFLIGGAYGFGTGKFGLEASLDYFKSSAEYIETKSILSRINTSFSLLKETAEIKPYLMVGVTFLNESSVIDIPEFDIHDEMKNKTFGLEFGTGIILSDIINGGLTYIVMPTSENVKGMVTLSMGYRFLFGGK